MPSSTCQRGGKANRIRFRSVVLATVGTASGIKADHLVFQFFILIMSNIIPLPFESTLSVSYADASELVQAMQHLEHHLVHIINIWITSKCFCISGLPSEADNCFCRFVGVLACPFGGREFSDEGANGLPGFGKPGDQGDDGTVVPCA